MSDFNNTKHSSIGWMATQWQWQWKNAAAGAIAGFATVAGVHPLDVVRTRFQVNDGRGGSILPTYNNTSHAVFSISRLEGLRGLYAGFFPALIGSTLSWGLYFFLDTLESWTMSNSALASAAEAGAFVCLCTNPIWLVKTRLQLQTPLHQTRPYSGLLDAFRTIMKEEGARALYKGVFPGLLLVSHGAIQFTAYEELRNVIVDLKARQRKSESTDYLLNTADYAALGASSKVVSVLVTYPFQVIRARLQQRPSTTGIPRYIDSLHVIKETLRFEGMRGLYRGITANLLKSVPASSITFIVYENVLKLLKQHPTKV